MYVFKEKQYFRKKFTFLILVAVSLFSIYATYNYVVERIGDELNILQLLTLLLPIGVAFLIGNISLNTRIDEIGIHYQFFPFHLTYKVVKWTAIKKCYVRNYNALTEFGGWGFRISIFRRKGTAYSINGNIGLQLELKNGKKILVGTQKRNEMERVLSTYKQKIETLD